MIIYLHYLGSDLLSLQDMVYDCHFIESVLNVVFLSVSDSFLVIIT